MKTEVSARLTGRELYSINALSHEHETLTDFMESALKREIASRQAERNEEPRHLPEPKVLVCRYKLVDAGVARPFDAPISANFSWHDDSTFGDAPIPTRVFRNLHALVDELPGLVAELPRHVMVFSSDIEISAISKGDVDAYGVEIDRSQAWLLVVGDYTIKEGYGDVRLFGYRPLFRGKKTNHIGWLITTLIG